jgi:hypothetical protein
MPGRRRVEDLPERPEIGGFEGGMPAADDFGVVGGVAQRSPPCEYCDMKRVPVGSPRPSLIASGELPIYSPSLRMSEFVAMLALAQDNAFGQPLESQLRSSCDVAP